MAAKLARDRATEFLLNHLLPQTTFTQQLSPAVICMVCRNVLREPMQLSCGHRVCKTCNADGIPTTADGHRVCPDDNDVIERVFPDRSALVDIMNLECRCVSAEDGCTWEGLLMELEEHYKGCEFCQEEECPYKEMGCGFRGSKGKLVRHFEEDALKHDCLLATNLKECHDYLSENRRRFTGVADSTPTIRKSLSETRNELLTMQQRLTETSVLTNNENENIEKLKEKLKSFEILLERIDSKKRKMTAITNEFQQLHRNVEEQMKILQDTTDQENNNNNNNNNKPLITTVKRLTTENDSHSKLLHELGIKIRIAQCSNNEGNYTWKLDNLETRFKEARAGKVRELYTPPLYTSKFGYKYSAKVMLGGDQKQNKDHVAIYIVIMQGDYDEILRFPFPYPIEITLKNLTRQSPDVTHILYPDPAKVHFQRPYKNMNPAIGFARFCAHARLYSEGFVKNDTIYFNINVKTQGVDIREPDI